MARILFIQDNEYEYQGVMFLSAILKQNYHECRLLFLQKNLLNKVQAFRPDFIFFYTMTGSHKKLISTAKSIKELINCITVFGGPHATFFPEMINDSGADIVCIGEGEYACLELANAFDKNKGYTKIKNLCVKEDERLFKNELRPLIENLDELPAPDRSIYYEASSFLKNNTTKNFITGRGCPYNCTFCFNKQYNEMYKGKGSVIRKHSKEYVITNIKDAIKKYPVKFINFVDDTFNINKKWLMDFLELYKKEVNLPFFAQIRINLLDEEIIRKLKESNCYMAGIGLESGNEEMRNKIIKKALPREKIIEVCSSLKKYGVKFETFNVLGLPNETIEQAFDTINLNIRIKADYTAVYLVQPYPKTELEEYSRNLGLLDDNFCVDNFPVLAFETSPLKNKYKKELINLQKFFILAVKYPFAHPIIRWLIKLPNNAVYDLIFNLCNLNRHKQVFGHSWVTVLKIVYKLKRHG